MKLLLSYGTRPEYIKLKPLIKALEGKIPFEVLFTGQQKDIGTGEFTKQKSISDGDNRLDSIVTSLLNDDWIYAGITHVMVQGDTTSAFAIALGAFHRQIKVIHLEAGLRTHGKNPYPEEGNRRMIDCISDIHLAPTLDNYKNLVEEGFNTSYIHRVGNTGIDNLKGIGISYNNEVIVTMHRRENHARMGEWFKEIDDLAQANPSLKFILPMHPNPNVRKHWNSLKSVQVCAPINYEEMIDLIAGCKFLISDSGGLQEEASFFNKKIIVCRVSTERPETVGVHSFLCPTPEELPDLFEQVKEKPIPDKHYCPYGDGSASEKVVQVLINEITIGVG